MVAVVLILFPTAEVYAAACIETRFIIEDEVSGQEIGLIYTDTSIRRSKSQEVCLEGKFLGKEYQYLYKCVGSGRFQFIQKFKTH
jgi:hypothetical protein